jgi:diguanylate cyclase (GGDEF)-like protein
VEHHADRRGEVRRQLAHQPLERLDPPGGGPDRDDARSRSERWLDHTTHPTPIAREREGSQAHARAADFPVCMTVRTRTRVLLVLAVAVLGVASYAIVSEQRSLLLRGQAQTASAGDLLTAMLDQETGVRGFDQTGSDEFLTPFHDGLRAFDAALAAARDRADDDIMRRQLDDQAATARRWQALAEEAIVTVRRDGADSLTDAGIRERKALMDRFRRENSVFREHIRAEADVLLRQAQWTAIGSVVLIGTVLLGGGLLLIERGARRSAQRRRTEREFIETLQGADHEDEAQELLQRHVERSVPGAEAVVLRRNASGNVLAASTDPAGVPGLAERLDGAAPRDCLAVRRGTAYARSEGDEPLQPCGICGALPGASQCTPSLVGGEVIGSLLVTRHKPLGVAAQETVSRAVTQAAPVLANLRNLAIAEHRAATDGLTGLPNARSAREALTRMVAQAGRSTAPLSVIALDLDHFKALNDRHGHQAGDETLAAVGAALRSSLRASDFAGRWGGEEFVVLLPDTDSAGALQVAGKLRELIAGITVPAVPAGVTASLGVAALPEHAGSGDELFRAADRALYAAKAAGRDRVELAGADAPVTAGPG